MCVYNWMILLVIAACFSSQSGSKVSAAPDEIAQGSVASTAHSAVRSSLASGMDYEGRVPFYRGGMSMHVDCPYALALTSKPHWCKPLLSNGDADVQYCSVGNSTHRQSLVVSITRSSVSSNQQAQAVYRVRVTGPEILLPHVLYCTDKTAVAPFTVTFSGKYHIEVVQLYENFTYMSHPTLHPAPFLANGELIVELSEDTRAHQRRVEAFGKHQSHPHGRAKKSDPSDHLLRYSTTSSKSHPLCTRVHGCPRLPTCSSPEAPGRWISPVNHEHSVTFRRHLAIHPGALSPGAPRGDNVTANQTTSLTQLLSMTCIRADPNQYGNICHPGLYQLAATIDHHQLQWLPYHCHLKSHKEIDLVACRAEKHFCFVGDSQMRHIYNTFISMHEDPEGLGFLHDPGTTGTDKDIMLVDYASLHWNTWGNITAEELVNCTHVLVNFGQWPAAYTAGSRAWSAGQYTAQLLPLAQTLQQLAFRDLKDVYWVTTGTHPLMNFLHGVNNRDWRTDPVLLLYNSLASTHMKEAGIDVIDTWSIGAPMQELSYDHGHYKGNVGYAVGLRVLNTLCYGY